jgi:hypothetical protein
MGRLWAVVPAAVATAICIVGAGIGIGRGEPLTFGLSVAFALLFGLAFALLVLYRGTPPALAAANPITKERLDADFLFEFAQSRLETQKSMIDSLDAKLGVIFSVGSAEIGALAAFLALSPAQIPRDTLVLSVSFISYVVLAGVAARGIWSRRWFLGPLMAEVVEAYRSLEKEDIKLGVAKSLIDAFRRNERPVEAKSTAVRIVIVALIVQTLGLLAAVGVSRPA